MQQTTLLPTLKYSGSQKRPGDSAKKCYFDVRVVDVGVMCPAGDLPENEGKEEKDSDITPRNSGKSARRPLNSSVPVSSGILVSYIYFY